MSPLRCIWQCYFSPGLTVLWELLRRPLDEVFQVINQATRETARNPLEFALQQDHTVGLTNNSMLVRRDGVESAIEDSAAPIHDREDVAVGAVIVFRDVGEAQAMATQDGSHWPNTTSSLNCPIAQLLNDRLTQAMAMANRHHRKFAVLFVDLDNFKPINDSLGHPIGDAVLHSVANRLRESLRDTDTVSRQGGDEFVILLSETDDTKDAALVAEKLVAALAAPHSADEPRADHVTASIGISIYPDQGRDAEESFTVQISQCTKRRKAAATTIVCLRAAELMGRHAGLRAARSSPSHRHLNWRCLDQMLEITRCTGSHSTPLVFA